MKLKLAYILTFILIGFASVNGFSPHILEINPFQNQLNIKCDSEIKILFDNEIDLYSVNDKSLFVYGSLTGFHKGTFYYDTLNNKISFTPNQKYRYGEVIRCTLTGNIVSKDSSFNIKPFIWYFNIESNGGSGVFDSVKVYETGYYPEGICTADFDNDGFLDLATPNYAIEDWTIAILFGNGDGTFSLKNKYPTERFPFSIMAIDVDNDGDMDIVVGNEENFAISVFYNDGEGNFSYRNDFAEGPNGFYPSICSTDIDGDGDIDILRSTSLPDTKKDNVLIFFNDGRGNFDSTKVLEVGDWPWKLSAYDVDKDGEDDIIVPNWNDNNINILFNHGGDFSQKMVLITGYGAAAISPNDFNNDSFTDLVIANNAEFNMTVLLNDGSNNFIKTNYQTGNLPRAISANDFDGDKDLDLVLNAGSNFISVFFNNGRGQFSKRDDYYSYGGPNYVISADFDNDGDIDIAATNRYSSTISVFLNRNSATNVQERNNIVSSYLLKQNYPNPFNPTTKIEFYIPKTTFVSLTIFDFIGNEIKTLVSEEKYTGKYSVIWDGTNNKNEKVSSSVYFYKLEANENKIVRKMILLK